MDYDLKITGGTIIDGTGSPARDGDVAIKDGKIAAVGEAPGKATTTIEARGRVVAPGFVDIHTHYDAQILWDRMMTISPWHGVTTVVMGNCGFGVAPTRPEHRGLIMRTLEKVEGMSLDALEAGLGYEWPFETFEQYLDAVEKRGSAINVGALIGHTPTRLYVMGEESVERPASEAEIAQMREIVRRGIRAGAVGFATSKSPTHVGYSGKPVPSRKAEMSEITALASVLARGEERRDPGHGRTRTVPQGISPTCFARTGRTITWTALLAGMTGSNDGHRRLLEQSQEMSEPGDAHRSAGGVPAAQLRDDAQGAIHLREPVGLQADLGSRLRRQDGIYADPEFRAMFKAKTGINSAGRFADRWERSWVSYYPGRPELEESNLAELARERGVDPIDLMLDIGLETKLEARFRMALFNYEEDEVIALLNGKGTVVGLSDAGAHASQLCDACFSTYLMGHWVRERKAIPIERAVWMLTARPAEVFALSDRGRLAPGLAGDVVVFDPDKIGCSRLRRVNDLPSGADRLVAGRLRNRRGDRQRQVDPPRGTRHGRAGRSAAGTPAASRTRVGLDNRQRRLNPSSKNIGMRNHRRAARRGPPILCADVFLRLARAARRDPELDGGHTAAGGIHRNPPPPDPHPSRVHDQRVHRVGGLLHFLLHLPLPRRRRAFRRPGFDPAGLFFDSDFAYHARGGDRAVGVDHARPRAARPLRAPSANRAMDVADLDVRVGDRRGGLSDGVPAISASAARGDGGCARSARSRRRREALSARRCARR